MSEPESETVVEPARDATKSLVRKIMIGTLFGAFVFAGLSLYADLSKLLDNLGRFRWALFAAALVASIRRARGPR